MLVKTIIKPIPIENISATTFNNTYLPINPNGLPQACNILLISNLTNQSVMISWDGSTDHGIQPSGNIKFLQVQTNAIDDVCVVSKGQVIYVKGAMGTGNIYVEGYYQPISE